MQRRKLLPLIAIITLSLATSLFGAAPEARADDSVASPLAAPVWLCYPGMTDNPCGQNADGSAQATASDGSLQMQYPVAGTTETIGTPDATYTDNSASSVDCFYVYPTVDTLPNPLLQVGSVAPTPQDAEMAVTLAQVARFAKTCRLFVPVYRQESLAQVAVGVITGLGIGSVSTGEMDVLQAWQYYWDHDNIDPATGKRRGVVLLGHSQGSADLISMIQQEIDGTSEQSQLVSAVLLGGNVQVPIGEADGEGGTYPDATFQDIPECSNSTAYGCVVAYSSYDEPSGDDPGSSALFGTATASGYEIACTNPTALLNGDDPGTNEPLDTYLPSEQLVNGNVLLPDGDLSLVLLGFTLPTVSAGFEEYQGALDGQCTYQGGSSWLQITGDTGLFPSSTQTSSIGLHVVDYNIDQGDLTALVARQASAWLAANGS